MAKNGIKNMSNDVERCLSLVRNFDIFFGFFKFVLNFVILIRSKLSGCGRKIAWTNMQSYQIVKAGHFVIIFIFIF